VGNFTQQTLYDLQDGTTYYLAVTAYNYSGDESNYSEELSLKVGDSGSVQNDSINGPEPPTLVSPNGSDLVDLRPTLQVDEFYDPDTGDYHTETEWQIYRLLNNNSKCVFELRSSEALTSLDVPALILDADKEYSWRSRFYDNNGNPSEWSAYGYFTTMQNTSDLNENGVPDSQEADPNADLDGGGIPDKDELNIKSVRVKDKKAKLVGLGSQDASKAVSIIALQSDNPDSQQTYPGMIAPPGTTPFGIIDFKVLVENPGDQAELTVYFSEQAPAGSVWYKYDAIHNIWIDVSDSAVLSPNRMSLKLYLEDGGPDDADGIANGIIVDPAGLVVPSSSSSSGSSGSGSSGCFIDSIQDLSGKEIESATDWFIIACLFLIPIETVLIRQFITNHMN